MKGFTKWLVKNRVMVIIICLALLIPSILGMTATKTKYDLLYYLPQDLETVKGQQILLDDFGKGAFSLLVTDGLTLYQQTELEENIKNIPHVESVMGYASLTKAMIPLEIIPEGTRDLFYKDGSMLTAVFFDDSSSSEETMEAIQQLRKVAGEKCFVSGLSAVVTDTKLIVEDQEAIYVGIAVALCAIVLMLTMDSLLLPIIFLICIGVSIIWNMGSNYFLGEISYITKAVAAVLQLGVTLDYSIFLWHSYKEQKTKTQDKDEAMSHAIHLTFTSILGSSLTTIAGFAAICFMSFTLGKDLGIVMIKGVLMGLISTVILLPCAIRVMDNAIEKTSHKPLLPDVGKIGKFVVNHYKILAIIMVIMAIPAFYGYNNVEVYYDMSKVMPTDLPSIVANRKLEDTFDTATTHLVLIDSDLSQEKICDMSEDMRKVDGVKDVLNIDTLLGDGIPEFMLPPNVVSAVKSDNYQLMLINSEYIISSDEVNNQIDKLNSILKSYDKDGMLIGEAPCAKDLIVCTDHDFVIVSLISIIAIFVIIMLVQKSFTLPIILVAIIELAIASNLCIPYFSGIELPFVGPILISTIQLGATVDYAILLTTRYKQNRISGMNKKDAVEKAIASAAQSVLVSGLGFFASTYGVGLYSNIDIISAMCRLIARGALLSVAVVLLLLPALLLLLDKIIVHTTFDMKAAR